jgi:hypothetical protein
MRPIALIPPGFRQGREPGPERMKLMTRKGERTGSQGIVPGAPTQADREALRRPPSAASRSVFARPPAQVRATGVPPAAREDEEVTCPNCGEAQAPAVRCESCGVPLAEDQEELE